METPPGVTSMLMPSLWDASLNLWNDAWMDCSPSTPVAARRAFARCVLLACSAISALWKMSGQYFCGTLSSVKCCCSTMEWRVCLKRRTKLLKILYFFFKRWNVQVNYSITQRQCVKVQPVGQEDKTPAAGLSHFFHKSWLVETGADQADWSDTCGLMWWVTLVVY